MKKKLLAAIGKRPTCQLVMSLFRPQPVAKIEFGGVDEKT